MSTSSFTGTEKQEIYRALNRLFIMQDKPLNDDKQTLFVNELESSGIPFRAILLGISKLCEADLKQVKLATILCEARKHTIVSLPKGCQYCHGTGFVDMVNKDRYSVSLACKCGLGAWYAKHQGHRVWNGMRSQFSENYGVLNLASIYDGMDIPDAGSEEQNTALVSAETEPQESIQWEE